MKAKIIIIAAASLLCIGAILHHSGNCPLKQAKATITQHSATLAEKP